MRLILYFLFFLGTLTVKSQSPKFVTDLPKGKILIGKRLNRMTTLEAKTLVYEDDIIQLKNAGDQVTLVDIKANYYKLDHPGSYKVADLLKKPKEESSGIAKKFFELLWEDAENPMHSNPKRVDNMLATWGGVVRGACDLHPFPFDQYTTGSDSLKFSWGAIPGIAAYNFKLLDEGGTPFLELQVRDTQLVIRSTGLVNPPATTLKWLVAGNNESCNSQPITLHWLMPAEYDRQLKEILANVPNDGSDWYYLEAAQALYSNHFFEKAVELLKKIR